MLRFQTFWWLTQGCSPVSKCVVSQHMQNTGQFWSVQMWLGCWPRVQKCLVLKHVAIGGVHRMSTGCAIWA